MTHVRAALTLGLLLLMAGPARAASAAERGDWPRSLEAGGFVITLYAPQVDRLAGDRLESRAAVSVRRAETDDAPVFGAVWLSARIEVDRVERLVSVRDLEVPHVKFPEAEQSGRDELAALLEREIPTWELTFDLDALVADLDGDAARASTPGLRHDPPEILYSKEPAVLVLYDGSPVFQPLEGVDGLERVANTPFPVVRETGASTVYLHGGGELWYAATDPLGPWNPTTDVPVGIAKLAEGADAEAVVDDDAAEGDADASPPIVLTATEPTELIVLDGPARWVPVEGLDLLYCDNTDSDVFLDVTTQSYWVLLSGRWYRGEGIEGDIRWVHVPNDELPEPFSDIPEDSVNGHVLAHVAGTRQAREEALENLVPETAAVRRDAPPLTVKYDGPPDFQPVEDLPDVLYAVNSATSVFRVGETYWACENAIWYRSSSPTTGWVVADEIPAVLYDVPPSNPHHNVTYVHVYESTPEVVYVGYTPGYVGSYWYRGCVVWGTGWMYHPWYRGIYYPRPWTWGLHVRYNPWYGWSFGLSWSNGPFRISIGWGGARRYGGWYGAGGYRPAYRPYPRPGYGKPVARPLPSTRPGSGARPPTASTRPAVTPGAGGTTPSVYDRSAVQDRVAARPSASDRKQPTPVPGRNDVYTDRNGDVYRRTENGSWEQRRDGGWGPAQGIDRPSGQAGAPSTSEWRPPTEARPSAGGSYAGSRPSGSSPPTASRPSSGATRPQLERDYRARQRGSQRSQQYRSTPRAAPHRGGGGRRR